ncbi:MAG TPA: hypothetical protein PK971_17020, partial [Saprospiraceae bacterium]|nr:hypothetical protein [Saprospiraceae bacterium]
MNQKRFQKQTDKGWQSMSELLEREMPATKRRRPAAVAWWSLALWVLTVLGLIAWWWNQKANQEQVLAPARQVQEEIKKQAPTTSYNAQPDPSTQQRRAAAPTSAAYVRNAQPQPRGQREHPSSWLADEGKTARAQAHNTLADAQLPAQQPLAENPENQAALAAAPEEDFSAGWRGQQLPPLPYHLLENEGALDLPASGGLPFPTKARVKSARNKRYSPWRVGASLTASTEHFNAANSASLGGVLDWQPKRSHWGLRSGLAYEHYRPSGFARPIAEVNADRYADATRNYAFLFNNGVYVPGTSEALGLDVALPVVLMQRLRVPLLVYWQ